MSSHTLTLIAFGAIVFVIAFTAWMLAFERFFEWLDDRRHARMMRRYDKEHPCFAPDGTRLGQYDGRYGG
jgi:hypothetical protein